MTDHHCCSHHSSRQRRNEAWDRSSAWGHKRTCRSRASCQLSFKPPRGPVYVYFAVAPIAKKVANTVSPNCSKVARNSAGIFALRTFLHHHMNSPPPFERIRTVVRPLFFAFNCVL